MNQKLIISFICGLIIGLIIMFKFTNKETITHVNYDAIDKLKQANNELLKRNEILTDSVSKLDTIRIKFITKYKYLKKDTVLPCDTLIKEIVKTCDTIITLDSAEIVNLKNMNINFKRVIANDSIIFDEQQSEIKQLKKEVKRQRRKRILATTLGIIATSATAYFLFTK